MFQAIVLFVLLISAAVLLAPIFGVLYFCLGWLMGHVWWWMLSSQIIWVFSTLGFQITQAQFLILMGLFTMLMPKKFETNKKD